MLSNQEIFDRAATHLLKQGSRAEGEDGTCAYRGVRGDSCAIGCLIPDDKYSDDIEGYAIGDIVVDEDDGCIMYQDAETLFECLIECDITDNKLSNYRFLSDLQVLHDSHEPEEWENELRELALKYELSAPVLN